MVMFVLFFLALLDMFQGNFEGFGGAIGLGVIFGLPFVIFGSIIGEIFIQLLKFLSNSSINSKIVGLLVFIFLGPIVLLVGFNVINIPGGEWKWTWGLSEKLDFWVLIQYMIFSTPASLAFYLTRTWGTWRKIKEA